MEKKRAVIVWTIFENEGYWYYAFGTKDHPLTRSGKIMTKAMAQKALNNEIEKIKKRYTDEYEVVVEEMTT
jgi:hypothetical protein